MTISPSTVSRSAACGQLRLLRKAGGEVAQIAAQQLNDAVRPMPEQTAEAVQLRLVKPAVVDDRHVIGRSLQF
jgi:hypothetical protein